MKEVIGSVPKLPEQLIEPDWSMPDGRSVGVSLWKIPQTGEARTLRNMLLTAGRALDTAEAEVSRLQDELAAASYQRLRAADDWEYIRRLIRRTVAEQADSK